MVYAGKTKSGVAHVGVSGRLRSRNLVMWDEETNSLWSQLSGKAIYGKRKGEVMALSPSVFVGLGTWVKIAPGGQVLALSNVRVKPWHYRRQDLQKGAIRMGGALALGLRAKGDTLAIPLSLLKKKESVEVEVGGQRALVLWHEGEMAPLAYRLPGGMHLRLKGGKLVGAEGAFDPLTGRSLAKAGSRPSKGLERFPYLPVLLKAWKGWYPKGKILGSED
jgi:hypothetical protein